ncbi:hypothetical protein [Algoriphagus formosus]|uniref:hypothetical protein n=1 Tax=Algoriphagus formosus TaxID=2007308 RepID=UPI000C282831|nr:hypothetical protein [Algoriphagus formosus]
MKKLPLFFLVILAGFLSSCEEGTQPCYPIDNNRINIQVLDQEGKDLLDQTKELAFSSNQIKIFYERNGSLEEFYNGQMTNMRRNFRIIPLEAGEDFYSMEVILDTEKTVIQWNASEADTLFANIVPIGDPNYCPTRMIKEVYHEGELKWGGSTSMTGRGFTIVKEL